MSVVQDIKLKAKLNKALSSLVDNKVGINPFASGVVEDTYRFFISTYSGVPYLHLILEAKDHGETSFILLPLVPRNGVVDNYTYNAIIDYIILSNNYRGEDPVILNKVKEKIALFNTYKDEMINFTNILKDLPSVFHVLEGSGSLSIILTDRRLLTLPSEYLEKDLLLDFIVDLTIDGLEFNIDKLKASMKISFKLNDPSGKVMLESFFETGFIKQL